MTIMKYFLLSILLITNIMTSSSQEAEILKTIDEMFQGMYKGDTATMRTYFTPGANLLTYKFDSKGNARAKGETLNDFLRGVALEGEIEMEVKHYNTQCLVDDGIASVWMPYDFYYEKKFNHCGVYSFQLIDVQGQWRMAMITDSRRKEDCLSPEREKRVIDSLMNGWHIAAAKADADAFFGLMTADAIYIGTDATERWLRDELKEWSKEYFQKETAWDFTPLSRNIEIGSGGQVAWFDELLDTWMGTCRSTGIMAKKDGQWLITYYHLSVAIPNEKIQEFIMLMEKD